MSCHVNAITVPRRALVELCDRVQQLVGGVESMELLIANAPGNYHYDPKGEL